jgi:uncharacterized membrane protein
MINKGENQNVIINIIALAIGCPNIVLGVYMTFKELTFKIADQSYSAGLFFVLLGFIVIILGLLVTLEIRKETKNLILIITSSGIGLLLGYMFWFSNTAIELADIPKYDLFRDLVTVFFVSATFIIALLSAAAYFILTKLAERKIEQMVDEALKRRENG